MQVILLERVAKLGQMGEVVNVKDGYARNFRLPQGKALRANDNNIKSFEVKKAQLEATNLETRKEAESVGTKLDGQVFIVIRSASDAGALYGSVTPRDAAEAGFTEAWATIVDSNLTTIAAAAFLFQFGTGPVKGFAVTLVIGLCASMFTAVFVSRLLFDLVYGSKEKVETVSI